MSKLSIIVPVYWNSDTLMPVSYTHLDVYKRQEWDGKFPAFPRMARS